MYRLVIFFYILFTFSYSFAQQTSWNLIKTCDFGTTYDYNDDWFVGYNYWGPTNIPPYNWTAPPYLTDHYSGPSPWVPNGGTYDSGQLANGNILGSNCLRIHAEKVSPYTYQGWAYNYKSGMLFSKEKTYGYGRYELRCKIPNLRGLRPSFWLWSNATINDTDKGEIDIMEWGWDATNGVNYPWFNIHSWSSNPSADVGNGWGDYRSGQNFSTDFHIYAVEWTETYLKWFIDEELMWMISKDNSGCWFPTTDSMAIIIGLQVDVNAPGENIDDQLNLSEYMDVDYLKIYEENSCKDYVICESSIIPTTLYCNNADLAISADVNYDGLNEVPWNPNTNSCQNYTCDKIINNGESQIIYATEEITLHSGFTSEYGSQFLAEITTSCNAPERLSNGAWNATTQQYSLEKSAMIIFPNPSSGKFDIDMGTFSNDKNYRITIKNILGEEVFSQNFSKNQLKINIENNPNGLYIINIFEEMELIYTDKILIQ